MYQVLKISSPKPSQHFLDDMLIKSEQLVNYSKNSLSIQLLKIAATLHSFRLVARTLYVLFNNPKA
jgi:hypothetical protein